MKDRKIEGFEIWESGFDTWEEPKDKKKPEDCFSSPDRRESRFFIGKEGWRENGLKEAISNAPKKKIYK